MTNEMGEAGRPPLADSYPLQDLMGYVITRWEQDLAVVEMPISDRIGNRYGLPHGGVYCMLLDTASGYCGTYVPKSQPKRLAMTVSLSVNFIGRPSGTKLIATGRKAGGGKNLFFTELELRCDEGNLIATGQGAMRYRNGSDAATPENPA